MKRERMIDIFESISMVSALSLFGAIGLLMLSAFFNSHWLMDIYVLLICMGIIGFSLAMMIVVTLEGLKK